MDYINGSPTGVLDTRTRRVASVDSRLILMEMTWDEIEEQYLKPISKKDTYGHKITDKSNGRWIQDHPEG